MCACMYVCVCVHVCVCVCVCVCVEMTNSTDGLLVTLCHVTKHVESGAFGGTK